MPKVPSKRDFRANVASYVRTECQRRKWEYGILEHFAYMTNTRRDLWGFGDYLVTTGSAIGIIQATTHENRLARVNKILTTTKCMFHAKRWLDSGGFITVWGFQYHNPPLSGRYWHCVEEEITPEDFV